MSKDEKRREILEKLIRIQKIPCSVNCPTKTGIELVSLDQALTSLKALELEELDKNKLINRLNDLQTESIEEAEYCSLLTKQALAHAICTRFGRVKEESILRELLWLRHGCQGLYGDDGEMQCGSCGIDFKRMSAQEIQNRFEEIALRKLTSPKEEMKKPIRKCNYCDFEGYLEKETICLKCGMGIMKRR